MESDFKKWLPWIVVVLLLLIIAAILAFGGRGGDDVAATTTSGATTTIAATSTTSGATTTTAAVTTTVPAATTTTAAATTTTAAATTTTAAATTTVAPTTTSATPPTLGPPAVALTLLKDGLAFGSTPIPFGSSEAWVIANLTDVLGPPTVDDGWGPSFSVYGTCPGDEVRGIEWDSLTVLFTKTDTHYAPAGTPHFFSYYYTQPAQPGFATPASIEIGSTLGDLKTAYPGKVEVFEAPFDPTAGIWYVGPQASFDYWGYASGQADGDTIESINAGPGCGE